MNTDCSFLNEVIIVSIFQELKIDAIAAVAQEYSWADADPDGRYYGVDYFLELNELKKSISQIKSQSWLSQQAIDTQLEICEKNIKESASNFLGIDSKNKVIKPIYEKLNANIKDFLSEKAYNFIRLNFFHNSVNEYHKKLLDLKAIDHIIDYWETILPSGDKDCFGVEGESIYYWELLLKEKDKIERVWLGKFDDLLKENLLECDFWKEFVEKT